MDKIFEVLAERAALRSSVSLVVMGAGSRVFASGRFTQGYRFMASKMSRIRSFSRVKLSDIW